MGKPRYTEWLTQEGLMKLEAWARDGLTDEQISHNMGCNIRTFYVWKKDHPQIDAALRAGKEVVDIQVENALYKRAIGYDYEEVKTIIETMPDGEERQRAERTRKHVPGDTTAQIFWLKNRKPIEWRDRRETMLSGSVETTTANPLEGLTRGEIRKLIGDE